MLIIDEKIIFFVIFIIHNNGITYHLYINNIENSNNRVFGWLFSTMD